MLGGLIRYRGRPQTCTHFPAKVQWTDSDDGQEADLAMDHWLRSEADRFHRDISLAVTLIALLILTAEAVRNHAPLELSVLGAVPVVIALVAWYLRAAFRAPCQLPGSYFRRDPSYRLQKGRGSQTLSTASQPSIPGGFTAGGRSKRTKI